MGWALANDKRRSKRNLCLEVRTDRNESITRASRAPVDRMFVDGRSKRNLLKRNGGLKVGVLSDITHMQIGCMVCMLVPMAGEFVFGGLYEKH